MDNITITKLLNQMDKKEKEEFKAKLGLRIARNNLTGDSVDTVLLEQVRARLDGKPAPKIKRRRCRNGKVITFMRGN